MAILPIPQLQEEQCSCQLMAKEFTLSTGKVPLCGLPRNSVVRITDCPDMTSAVDCGNKASTQPTKQKTYVIPRAGTALLVVWILS